jgi:hypothetical protein
MIQVYALKNKNFAGGFKTYVAWMMINCSLRHYLKWSVSRATLRRPAGRPLVLPAPLAMGLEKPCQVLFAPLLDVLHLADGWCVCRLIPILIYIWLGMLKLTINTFFTNILLASIGIKINVGNVKIWIGKWYKHRCLTNILLISFPIKIKLVILKYELINGKKHKCYANIILISYWNKRW